MNQHPLKDIVIAQKQGKSKGIYSICSANEYVIEAAMERAMADDNYILIEATANQVNQFGGYTGMKPSDFRDFVFGIADKISYSKDKIILGGDHLGPLTWKKENEASAMEKSCELIREYILAGFTKIHIDTSMHLGDDNAKERLSNAVIARRGATLCKVSEESYKEYLKIEPSALQPVYVVGSEVPIPGGSQEEGEVVSVTKVQDFEETVKTFKETFYSFGLESAWKNVIAVVVQPGVEFGDDSINEYNRDASKELCNVGKTYQNVVFEGHSTDFQTKEALKKMVEDGIAILKVGPALTFALREGLFALAYIENELFKFSPEIEISNFIEVLDKSMVKNPDNWKNHYHGTASKIRYSRKFSLSDRCRYYLPVSDVSDTLKLMISNLKSTSIPLALINQFLPKQYDKIRMGILKNDPESLLKDRIINLIEDYCYAIN